LGRVVKRVALLATIAGMAFLAYWSLRLAWADRLSRSADPQTVARAVRLSPGDADFRLKLAAEQQAATGDPTPALEAAAALEPGNADAWMRLGLASEMHGDLHIAETRLLKAAGVSRQFAPRWALANFYFRRGDNEHFWPWARESLLRSYGDLSPIFQLCWHMSQDAQSILERAIPDRPAVLNSYLQFLLQQGMLQASEQPAMRLANLGTPDDVSTLVVWCNRQLDAGSVPAAVTVWNTLCRRGILPFAPVRDRAPLSDRSFRAPFGSGFAWRLPTAPGISCGRNRSPHYLWVKLNGDQPETCSLLLQYVPVTPGGTYCLRFEYHTAADRIAQLPAASGVRWGVYDARTGIDTATVSPWLSSPSWRPDEMRFRAPSSGVVRLTLTYQRVPGETRIQGTVDLRNLSLERVP
jgi:hypothetical protein